MVGAVTGGPRLRPSCVYFLLLCFSCSDYVFFTYANPSEEICVANGYNIQNLTKALYWYYEPDVKDCPTNSTFCRYSFAVCKRLPSDFECDCSVALEAEVNSTNTTNNIGAYDVNKNPFHPLENSFKILYTLGQIQSMFVFTCDLSAKWIVEDGDKISKVPDAAQTKIKFNELQVQYMFYLNSAEACSLPKEGLSTGSIMLLIFFPTLAIYFLLGIILNKVGGAHGKELVPNYEFWNSLPGLIADGVVFTWSMMTCQGSKGVSGYDSI